MRIEYVFLETAQKEYEEALAWYLERSEKAGVNFVKEVQRALELITDHPMRWRNEVDDFYELTLRRYPYSIIYMIDSDRMIIVVTGVFHHKRNPKGKFLK